MKIILRIMFFACVGALLAACSNNGVQVTANFKNTQDISEGTTVYLGDKVIGAVNDISRTEHGSVVLMSLDSELAQQVSSRAAVVVNRLRQGAPLELHNPPGKIRQPLKDGQTVEALDSMLQLAGWGLGSTLKSGTESLETFKNYLGSKDFERDAAQMSIAIDRKLKSAKDDLDEAGKNLRINIDELNLSEQELAAIVAELGDEMAPMVEDIARGGAELMLELERFAKNLEQLSDQEQRTGEEFLRSLTDALDQINHSFDQGIQQGFEQSSPEPEPAEQP